MDTPAPPSAQTTPRRRWFLQRFTALATVGAVASLPGAGATARPSNDLATGPRVLDVARKQLGIPYAWGGGDRLGPSIGFCDDLNGYLDGMCSGENTIGFDCSGLALYCWYHATDGNVDLPHYTTAQHHKGIPTDAADLRPGDLLFFSRPDASLHHVGIYAGHHAMIHAERTGTRVAQLDHVFQHPTWGPQYAGAVRPTLMK